VRISSRGGKIPNYVDDVQDFGQFEDEELASGYYGDPNMQEKEEDEIEAILSHTRDETRLDDPEDSFYENVVRFVFDDYLVFGQNLLNHTIPAFPYQMEELFASS